MVDNCKGHEVIKEYKGADMCQLCFISALKLKTMTTQNWHMSALNIFWYSVSNNKMRFAPMFKVASSGAFLYY